MKKIIFFIIVLAAIFEGCKKYPDGPLISLRTAKHRLYGTYTLTQYTVNGVDSLSLYNDSLSLNYTLGFDGLDDVNFCTNFGLRTDGKEADVRYNWDLSNNNKNISLNIPIGNSYSMGTGPFGKNKTTNWEILRLTNKETKMQTTYNGKEYLIDLKKN